MSFFSILNSIFKISKNKTSISKEVRAGLTTFFSMAYIIQVNPLILSESGMSFSALVTSTVLVVLFSSLTMSFYANKPFVLAPGLGINGFFVYTMVLQMNIPVEQALGATFISGVIFLLLSFFKVREAIIKSVPQHLKQALCVGIGLFIARIGGQQILDSIQTQSSLTIYTSVVLAIVALISTGFFALKKIKGGLCLSIIFITALCISLDYHLPTIDFVEYKGWFAPPDFSLLFSLDILGSLKWSVFPAIFSLAFVDLFESLSTLMSLNSFTKTKGSLKKPLVADALGTMYGGLLGTSAVTVYLESAAGLKEGGRTGLTSFVTGLLFLPFMFIAPLIALIPTIATAPILILIGIWLLPALKQLDLKKLECLIPALSVMVTIPLTLSITNGLIAGFLTHTLLQIAKGNARKISKSLYIITALSLLALFLI